MIMSGSAEGTRTDCDSGGPHEAAAGGHHDGTGPFEVVLRGGRPWGFTLQGGAEVDAPLTIAKIDAGGKAGGCDRIRVGDQVLRVNDVSVAAHDEAVELVHGAFRTLALLLFRGAFEQPSSPHSVSFLKKAGELKDKDREKDKDRSQDDSIVYSESKSSRHGSRLKPQRRGESFNIRSTSATKRDRPVSWHPIDANKNQQVAQVRPAEKKGSKLPNEVKSGPATKHSLNNSMQYVANSADSLSMSSYASFQSLQNLGPTKSASTLGVHDSHRGGSSTGPAAGIPPSMSWHGVPNSMSNISVSGSPQEDKPIDSRRKASSSSYDMSSRDSGLPFSPRSRSGIFNDLSEDTNSVSLSSSYSQSHSVLPGHGQSHGNYGPSQPNVVTAHSMQDIRHGDPASADKGHSAAYRTPMYTRDYSYWSRPTPYKANNYENIDAFEAARNAAAATSPASHASPIQAQAYSHSYSNLTHSRTFPDGFLRNDHSPEPPEIPPWPKDGADHRKMLSEDSGVGMSITSPVPPIPPLREDSKVRYMKSSLSHERIPSWPVSSPEEDKTKTGSRANSWASYQPRLNPHVEEKADSGIGPDEFIKHSFGGKVDGDDNELGLTSFLLDSKGEVEIKNLYNVKPSYPYVYESRTERDYGLPSGKETERKGESAKDTSSLDSLLHQYGDHSRRTDQNSPSSPAPSLPKSAPPSAQSAPPLPQTAPPPMPSKQRSGQGHTIIVRQKPYYNTGTQTEVASAALAHSSHQYYPTHTVMSPRTAAAPVVTEPLFRNVEIQVNMDLVTVTPIATPMSTLERRKHKKADQGCQVQPSMLSDVTSDGLQAAAGSMGHDNYADLSSIQSVSGINQHRTAPIVDKMEQGNRIPETIREESPKKYEVGLQENGRGDGKGSGDLKDTILQQINDHSPSQTSMLRKLSQEFFGNQAKSGLGYSRYGPDQRQTNHGRLLAPQEPSSEVGRRRTVDPVLHRHMAKDYWSPDSEATNQEASQAVATKATHIQGQTADNSQDTNSKSGSSTDKEATKRQKSGGTKFDRSKKLSLRKAFGIFEEIENVDDYSSIRSLGSHKKSVSMSNVPSGNHSRQNYKEIRDIQQQCEPQQKEKPRRWYNRPRGDEVRRESGQHHDGTGFSQEWDLASTSSKSSTKLNSNDIQSKKLKRTTSEQIRPMKERIGDQERSGDKQKVSDVEPKDKPHKLSDPIQRHKNSDPTQYGNTPDRDHFHRSSDPSVEEYRKLSQHRLSDPSTPQDQRMSGDSDLFRGSHDTVVHTRPSSGRSTSTSSLDGHRTSDPELKKVQHMAVINFFEMKTGKRLSSSSMDSSGNGSDRGLPKDKYGSISSRGSTSSDFLVGGTQDGSPPHKSQEEQEHILAAIKKSKSMPWDISSHLEDQADVAGPQQRQRRRSAPRWPYRAGEKSPHVDNYAVISPATDRTEGEWRVSGSTDQGRQEAAQDDKASTNHKPGLQTSPGSSPERTDNSEPLDSTHTYPKQTYEYSSSSSGGSSPTKSPSEYSPKPGFQLTINKSYAEDEGSPPPPTLPPRNYRPERSEYKFRPPPTPVSSYPSDLATDFENTPQPDTYANQLRQQMLKFSQSQSSIHGVNSARLHSRPLPDIKTNVVTSRPVDRQPIIQEAVAAPPPLTRTPGLQEAVAAPPPLTRTPGLHDLSYAGISEGSPGASSQPDSHRPARGEVKIEVIHVNTSQSPSSPPQQHHQQQQQPQKQHQPQPQISSSTKPKLQWENSRGSPKERRIPISTQPPPTLDLPPPPTVPPPNDPPNSDAYDGELPLPPPPPPPVSEDPTDDPQRPYDEDTDDSPASQSERYSSDSYMQKRSHPRQGFGGNYRRSNSSEGQKTPPSMPTVTSSPLATSVTPMVATPLRKDSVEGSGPVTTTNPPKSETLVKVATTMTVTKPPLPSESRTQLEPGPVRKPAQPPQVPPKYASGRLQRSLATTPPDQLTLLHQQVPRVKASTLSPEESILTTSYTRTCVTNLDEASRELASIKAQQKQSSSASPTGSQTTTRTKVSEIGETLRKSLENVANSHNVNGDMSPQSKDLINKDSCRSEVPSELKVFATSSTIVVNPVAPPDVHKPPSPVAVRTPTSAPSPGRPAHTAAEMEVPSTPPPLPSPPPPPVVCHVRQKSHEEIECEKAATVVAIQIVDEDKRLSEVILPPPEHKTTTDFMSGIFDTNLAGLPRKPTFAKRRSPRQQDSNENSFETSPVAVNSWSPPSVALLKNKMKEEGMKAEEILREMGIANTSLRRQKEELESRIKRKLAILREEKETLGEEIEDNNQLGKEVCAVVECKVQSRSEFDKFKLYVDELDKVMYLLIKLSGRLARSENAVLSLPPNADNKEKTSLMSKRDEVSEKHEDAKLLKEGIDRRSVQVSAYLKKYLTDEEYDNYEYFIKMKSKLTMDQQEIEDKIKLGEEQLQALQNSMAATS